MEMKIFVICSLLVVMNNNIINIWQVRIIIAFYFKKLGFTSHAIRPTLAL